MKENQVQLKSLVVSPRCRTYSYQVTDTAGEIRQFSVEVSLDLFRTGPLKFQDGPLISQERLLGELERESEGSLANEQLQVSEPDIHSYMERHYPPKARTWNGYKPAPAATK